MSWKHKDILRNWVNMGRYVLVGLLTRVRSDGEEFPPPLWTVFDRVDRKILFRATSCRSEALRVYQSYSKDYQVCPPHIECMMKDFPRIIP